MLSELNDLLIKENVYCSVEMKEMGDSKLADG